MLEFRITGQKGREVELEGIAERLADAKLEKIKTDRREYREFLLESARVGINVGEYVLEEIEQMKSKIK
ncbi:hypothetical protein D3C79_924490 [compost metagenome]